MVCNHCKSEWRTDRSISISLAACPFCGKSLADEDDGTPKTFGTSRETLIYIAQQHGNDVLLGKKLKSFFPDYAPQVPRNIRALVFSVYENGACAVLQASMNAKPSDQVIAFKQAVAKLTEAFIAQEAAENIIREFVAALGWQISSQFTTTQQTQPTRPVQQPTVQVPPPTISAVTEIRQGKKQGIAFGGYTWQALEVESDRALLLSEDILEMRPYHDSSANVTWETCTLRRYLNGEFFQWFSAQEQARITEVLNVNENNQWFCSSGSNNTKDRVFLLSLDEVLKYFFEANWQLDTRPSEKKMFIRDRNHHQRIAWRSGKSVDESDDWWLRSPDSPGLGAAWITGGGDLFMLDQPVFTNELGVRPALWLKL